MKYGNIVLLVVMLVLVYALLLLPQKRQQKARQAMLQQLSPGAKVLTSGGMYGQIQSIHDDILVVKVAEDVEIEMDSRAIVRVVERAPSQLADEESIE